MRWHLIPVFVCTSTSPILPSPNFKLSQNFFRGYPYGCPTPLFTLSRVKSGVLSSTGHSRRRLAPANPGLPAVHPSTLTSAEP